jgi:hypothetical protein
MTNLTTGNLNVATGANALELNTTGDDNVATGPNALSANTTGSRNVATGSNALISNTTGEFNVATGRQALFQNTTGGLNVATGPDALVSNTTGNRNVATGTSALGFNETGNANVAVGYNAGQNLTGSNNIDLGNVGRADEAGTIRIGNKDKQTATFIAGISGKTVSGTGTPVVINDKGQLGTASAAKPAASKTATDRRFARMEAEIKRQQRQIGRLQREVRKHG